MIKTVVFDLDGTLLDTIHYLSKTLNSLLESYGFKKCTIDEIKSYMGDGAYDFVKRALPKNIAGNEDFCRKFFDEYLNTSAKTQKIQKFNGIDSLILALCEKGITLCVQSNKTHEAVLRIINENFPKAFKIVLGYKEEYGLKPNPSGIFYIAKETGSCLDEILFVGDGEADTLVAKNADIMGVGALWGYRNKEQLLKVGCINFAEKPLDVLKYV